MRYGVGTRVRVHGLVRAEIHNGKSGHVVGYLAKERYKVVLIEDEKKAEKKPLSVKEFNFEAEEVCPICLEAMMPEVLDFARTEACRMSCCGKTLCCGCSERAENELTNCPCCRGHLACTDWELFDNVKRHAEDGRDWACHDMSKLYLEGKGVPQDDKIAFRWSKKAADAGYVPACYLLGECYITGRGTETDVKTAWDYYTIALQRGHALAQWRCGLLYLYGLGVDRDVLKSMRLIKLAANQGCQQAKDDFKKFFKNRGGETLSFFIWGDIEKSCFYGSWAITIQVDDPCGASVFFLRRHHSI